MFCSRNYQGQSARFRLDLSSLRLIDGFHWLSRAHPVYPRSMAKSKDKKPKAKTNKAKLTAKEKKEKKLKKKER